MRLPCTPRTRRQPFRPISATYRGHSQRRSQGTPPAVSKTKVCDTWLRSAGSLLLPIMDAGSGEGTSTEIEVFHMHQGNDPLSALLRRMEAFGNNNDAVEADRSRKMLNLERDTAELISILVRSSGRTRILEIGTSNG